MSRRASRKRRSDYGTVILHWLLVLALTTAILTGLRIAGESPEHTWLSALDFVLPRRFVWTEHIQVAVVLIAIAIAYPIYVALAGLSQRIRFDRVRLAGLFGRREARLGAFNIILYWVFYIAFFSEIMTGALMYFDYAGSVMFRIHWLGMWIILACAFVHVFVHLRIGGLSQLLRILRPTRLAPQPSRFDPLDLLDLLDQPKPRQASSQRGLSPHGDGPAGPVLQSNPFVVAFAVAIASTSILVIAERRPSDTLEVRRIAATEVPVIDGDTSDHAWQLAKPLYVMTGHGDNFGGRGETTVEIRAVHDGRSAYFLFVWDDPTRSLKQLPLMKTAGGWKLLHAGYEKTNEHAYSEDKFSVLLTTIDVTLAGDTTFHAGAKPVAGRPASLSGRGLHYTERAGTFVDVWEWKATSTNATGFMDDDHFGPPAEPSAAEMEGHSPYRGGFAPDPGTASYDDNFTLGNGLGDHETVTPRRLPKNLEAAKKALGTIDLDPNQGESKNARWNLTEDESTPYSSERDAEVPVGTVVPGVIISGTYSGDRADVRCMAHWAAGRWALEVVRELDTGNAYDVRISTETFMRVAAFDHSQIGHTRHVRPIRLELE
jgi:Ethylbenzene dehydrogenase/Prokaryotic cytochrome b561